MDALVSNASSIERDVADQRRRFYDPRQRTTIVRVRIGETYVTNKLDEGMLALLGSAVMVVAVDRPSEVAGAVVLMLPGDLRDEAATMTALRYSAHMVEDFLTALYRAGAVPGSLDVRLFGGGAPERGRGATGETTLRFIREYLKQLEITITNQAVGDVCARRVTIFPSTGRVMMRELRGPSSKPVFVAEVPNRIRETTDAQGNRLIFD